MMMEQVQTSFQIDQKCFQKVATKFLKLIACLLTCLPACLPAYLPACLPTCLPAYLPACLPACLIPSDYCNSTMAKATGLNFLHCFSPIGAFCCTAVQLWCAEPLF